MHLKNKHQGVKKLKKQHSVAIFLGKLLRQKAKILEWGKEQQIQDSVRKN